MEFVKKRHQHTTNEGKLNNEFAFGAHAKGHQPIDQIFENLGQIEFTEHDKEKESEVNSKNLITEPISLLFVAMQIGTFNFITVLRDIHSEQS